MVINYSNLVQIPAEKLVKFFGYLAVRNENPGNKAGVDQFTKIFNESGYGEALNMTTREKAFWSLGFTRGIEFVAFKEPE